MWFHLFVRLIQFYMSFKMWTLFLRAEGEISVGGGWVGKVSWMKVFLIRAWKKSWAWVNRECGTFLREVASCLEMRKTWLGAHKGYSWRPFCLLGNKGLKEQWVDRWEGRPQPLGDYLGNDFLGECGSGLSDLIRNKLLCYLPIRYLYTWSPSRPWKGLTPSSY